MYITKSKRPLKTENWVKLVHSLISDWSMWQVRTFVCEFTVKYKSVMFAFTLALSSSCQSSPLLELVLGRVYMEDDCSCVEAKHITISCHPSSHMNIAGNFNERASIPPLVSLTVPNPCREKGQVYILSHWFCLLTLQNQIPGMWFSVNNFTRCAMS